MAGRGEVFGWGLETGWVVGDFSLLMLGGAGRVRDGRGVDNGDGKMGMGKGGKGEGV